MLFLFPAVPAVFSAPSRYEVNNGRRDKHSAGNTPQDDDIRRILEHIDARSQLVSKPPQAEENKVPAEKAKNNMLLNPGYN